MQGSTQKENFLQSEGDAYFRRNAGRLTRDITPALQALNLRPRNILEIGCSNGIRLDGLRRTFGAKCHGIDPSRLAIEHGLKTYPDLDLTVGTADRLPFQDASFDLVIFGFFLYACDPADHFRIVAEGNRVLSDPGTLVIVEWLSRAPYRNPYAHKPGLFAYKMDYAQLFLAHPSYRLLSRGYGEESGNVTFGVNECVTVDVLRKDLEAAFPIRRPGTP